MRHENAKMQDKTKHIENKSENLKTVFLFVLNEIHLNKLYE